MGDVNMDPFPPSHQPDEGYSEDPLNPTVSPLQSLSFLLSNSRSSSHLQPWLASNLPGLPLSVKRQLAMAVLDDLPTSVISEIVKRLNPRLYIDFVRYLPPEVCLKVFEYLDPVSLMNVAHTCKAWNTLASDPKLWERLYYIEGWKVILPEIEAAERKMNELAENRVDPQAHDTRALREPGALLSSDEDFEMDDASGVPEDRPMDSLEPTEVDMVRPPSSKGKAVDRKGKEIDDSAPLAAHLPNANLPSSSSSISPLWCWDVSARQFRISWKCLYSLRRRLEMNWELGRYTNYQLPLPEFPEEGHTECIYSIQYTPDYLVSGSRDKTLRIWNMHTRRLARKPLVGHTASVLCLQFDTSPEEDIIVSGGSDSQVILWRFSTGEILQRLTDAHRDPVLNLRFDKRILVSCSKDRTIKIFNRQPLGPEDEGYPPERVNPVPIHLRSYDYESPLTSTLPILPPYSMIGKLEGHNAAVNAVQICGNQIVSASGDRGIKVWDWLTRTCIRTIPGHGKGIACVQYDGRRIVSGSSDNEVKVFDSATGLEVASLRAHTNLVRTVQAGFGDLVDSVEEDRRQAREIDAEYFRAVESGLVADPGPRAHLSVIRNAGSRRPQDITAYGATLPPGGGGGKYARIVSGSYDQSVIIWRRDKDGVWKDVHHLRQDDAVDAAYRLPSSGQHSSRRIPRRRLERRRHFVPNSPHATGMPPPNDTFHSIIDTVIPQGPGALRQAMVANPNILAHHMYLQNAIDRISNPASRAQLREELSAVLGTGHVGLINPQIYMTPPPPLAGPSNSTALPPPTLAGGVSLNSILQPPQPSSFPQPPAQAVAPDPHFAAPAPASSHQPPAQAPPANPGPSAAASVQAPDAVPPGQPQGHPAQDEVLVPQEYVPNQQHPHVPTEYSPARVFKLQFDARRIICCSQTSVIIGWDFCNGDRDVEEASRFFAPIE